MGRGALGLSEGGFSRSQTMTMIKDGPHPYISFDPEGPGIDLGDGEGKLAWNAMEDCLDIYHKDGSVLQAGLEQAIIVHNATANTLYNGTVVGYEGVFEDSDYVPSVTPFIADGTDKPYYLFGVLTVDIEPGHEGRVTEFGKVRGIDTTGTEEGEEWLLGDILYVSTMMPGKLTKVKPSTPDPVVGMAIVLRVDAEEGIILVRPNIDKIMHFGHFSRTTDQAILTTTNPVVFDLTEVSQGIELDGTGTKIIFNHPGLYNIFTIAQMYSTNAADKHVKFWWRKNGTNVDLSTTAVTNAIGSAYFAANRSDMFDIERGDELELMVTTNVLSVSLKAIVPDTVKNIPGSPSISLHIMQVQN